MKTSLAHLPPDKQDDLARVVQIILACARESAKADADAAATDTPGNPGGPGGAAGPGGAGGGVEMVILYGSHARGDWTYDKYKEDWITYEYVSDYDVLIITENGSGGQGLHKNHAVWDEVRDRFAFGRPREGERSAGLSLIVHTVHEVNRALEEDRYFFADIQREGVLLFDSGRVKLASRIEPTPEQRKARATEEFERWFGMANRFMRYYEVAFGDGAYKDAAFLLHQATEHLYTTMSMVYTDYRPKIHDLYRLRARVAELDRRTLKGFALHTADQKRLFRLLVDAYVHARYTKTYTISKEDLEYLAQRVQKLRGIVETVCQEKIERGTWPSVRTETSESEPRA